MTVKELKQQLEGVPDDARVLLNDPDEICVMYGVFLNPPTKWSEAIGDDKQRVKAVNPMHNE